MSVNVFENGRLIKIARMGNGNTFTGTAAEAEEALENGQLTDGTVVNITDDYKNMFKDEIPLYIQKMVGSDERDGHETIKPTGQRGWT